MDFLSPGETYNKQKKRAMMIVNKALVEGGMENERCISLQEIPSELYLWVSKELELNGWTVMELNEEKQWIVIRVKYVGKKWNK